MTSSSSSLQSLFALPAFASPPVEDDGAPFPFFSPSSLAVFPFPEVATPAPPAVEEADSGLLPDPPGAEDAWERRENRLFPPELEAGKSMMRDALLLLMAGMRDPGKVEAKGAFDASR